MKKYKNNLVPRLRFHEFLSSGEWENKTVAQISSDIIAGGTPSTLEHRYWGGSIRWMNSGELNLKKVYEVKGRITKEGLQKSSTKLIPKQCVLIGLAGQGKTRGTVAMNMIELCINQSIAAIFPNIDVFESTFLYHNLDYRYDELRRLSTGDGGRGGLNIPIIKSLPILLPSIREQQKIADCLSSLDELITAEDEKLTLLKTYKKGLMQKLFPSKGESVPKSRFPEFRDSGEWEEKTLGDILIKNSIKNKKLKYILVQSVSNKYGFINQDEYFDDRRVASKDTSNYYVITKGCFAYNPSRIDVGSLAYKYDDEISIISPLYVSFKANNKKIIDIFLLNWFSSDIFKNQMIFEGGVRNTLNYDNLSLIKFKFPTPPEQQKIADCLSSLDDLINTQYNKIKKLKEHKKGLTQGLFPSAADIEKGEDK